MYVKTKYFKIEKYRKFLFARAMILVTLFAFLATGNLRKWHALSLPEENVPVCDAPQCELLGKVYLGNLNLEVDPCQNFYKYACSRWKKVFEKPDYEELWTVDKVAASRTRLQLRVILEESDPSDTDDEKAAKKLYNICMQTPFLERKSPKVLNEFITSAGKWPMFFNESEKLPKEFEWWRVDNHYLGLAGESAIFDFSFERSSRKSMTILFKLTKPRSTFGLIKDLELNDWPRKQRNSYAEFLMLLARSVRGNRPKRTRKLKRDVMDVISFRERFQEMVATLKDEYYTKMPDEDFQDWYDSEIGPNDTGYVDWLEQMRVLRGIGPMNAYNESTTDIKVSKKYFSSLASLLINTPPEVIVNHIHLYFIERHVKPTYRLRKLLVRSVTSADHVSGALRRMHQKWEWCIGTHHMWITLSQLYVKRYFPEKSKIAVQGLVRKTQELLGTYIANSTWLSMDEKMRDIYKLKGLKSMIGYPDWYDDPKRQDRELISAYPIFPNAYVTEPNGLFVLNHLSITAAYLQRPIYTPDVPYVIDFGSTMYIIGHELHHLFKTKTPPYSTNASIPWWPRSNCFINLYKTFKNADLRRLKVVGKVELNSVETVNEDIADAMGLKLAFDAFKRKRKEENGTCAVLPGFETFGCEKLFFIAFANTMCADSTRGAQLRFYLNNKHSSPKVRVNGAVSNMKEFADAFGCKSNDHMVPTETCSIW